MRLAIIMGTRSKKDIELLESLVQNLPEKLAEIIFSDNYAKFLKDIISEIVKNEQQAMYNEIKVLKENNQQLMNELSVIRQQISKQNNNNVNKQTVVKLPNMNQKTNTKVNRNLATGSKIINANHPSNSPSKLSMEENDEHDLVPSLVTAVENTALNNVIPYQVSQDNISNIDKEEGFTPVSYKRKRRNNTIIRGSGEATNNHLCVQSKVWIFLGRCSTSSTTEDVMSYLKDSNPDNTFEVTDLQSKGRYKSYRIGADLELKDYLFRPESWPKGAVVKRYLFRREAAASFNNGN